MTHASTSVHELRRFGVTVGAIVAGIGLWPVIRYGAAPHVWVLAVGSILVLAGWIAPRTLAPVQRGWMALGHLMGWINTRIILTLFFYGILTPMGLVARLLGKDFMRLRRESDADSYRVSRYARPAKHVRHQF